MFKHNILQTFKRKLERIKAKLHIITSFLLRVKLNNIDTTMVHPFTYRKLDETRKLTMAHPFTYRKLDETRKLTCKINKKILLWNANDEPHNPIQKAQCNDVHEYVNMKYLQWNYTTYWWKEGKSFIKWQ
jgi:hypothetical protein